MKLYLHYTAPFICLKLLNLFNILHQLHPRVQVQTIKHNKTLYLFVSRVFSPVI